MSRAIVLWTGGKDCNLALYEARTAGLEVVALLTFAPAQPEFRAHPLAVMAAQAEALGLPHQIATVGEPYEPGYRSAIVDACAAFEAGTVVTGDIDAVGGRPNWVRQCCAGTGIEVSTPLWGEARDALLRRLVDLGFVAVVSCVKEPMSRNWVGRRIDAQAAIELTLLAERDGMDASGEQGEYHTYVIDGPGYVKALNVRTEGIETKEGLSYLKFRDVELAPRPIYSPSTSAFS